jgi:glutamate-1-semialdehyde 2,1-aminomutase
VYQAGTLSDNPLAMAAGAATLQALSKSKTYENLEAISAEIEASLRSAAQETGWLDRICINRVGSMFTLFFCKGPVHNFADAKAADATLYAKFFRALLDEKVYFPPSQFEAAFTNLSMDAKAVRRAGRAFLAAFAALELPVS